LPAPGAGTLTDVLIAGAGPVGLVTALGLQRAGVSVTVLEAEPAIVASPRAIVYHWPVLPGLERLGVLDEVEARGIRKQDYAFRVHETGEVISYSTDVLADDTPRPYNVHLGQDELARIVLDRLDEGTVQWSTSVESVTQDGESVTVNDGLRARWLIGADGARSAVRRALELPFEGFTWPERFVATNVFYDFEAHGYPRAVFQIDPDHGAIIVKIDDAGRWRVTYAEDASLPEETVAERIPKAYESLLPGGEPYELDAHAPYRMHQRAAQTFRSGRVLLAGDAAHATNPTGGLGLTGGLFDAFSLAPTLASVVLERTSDDALDAWADERRQIFLELTSPAASENKRVVYSERDPERRRADVEAIRAWTSDRDMLRERLRFTSRLESSVAHG